MESGDFYARHRWRTDGARGRKAPIQKARTRGPAARALATLGHNLSIAARNTYEFQAPGVRAPQRLRDINEIQHRVFEHIIALTTVDKRRYPDDDLISIVLDFGDEHVRAQSLWALQDALERTPER